VCTHREEKCTEDEADTTIIRRSFVQLLWEHWNTEWWNARRINPSEGNEEQIRYNYADPLDAEYKELEPINEPVIT